MADRHRYFFRRLLVMAAAVAAPLMALQAYSLWTGRQTDLEDAKRAVQARVDRTARQADAALTRFEQLLSFLEARPELQHFDPRGCTELIKGLTRIDPLLANVGVIDLQGRPMCRSVESPAAYASYAELAWVKGALAVDGPYLSGPYRGEISERWLVNIVHPLRDGSGHRIGLLAAAMDLEALSKRILSTEGMPDGSILTLAGADSTIFAVTWSSSALIGRKPPPELFARYLVADKAGPQEAVGIEGSPRMVALARMQHFGLLMGAGLRREAVVAASGKRARDSAIVAVLVAAAAFGLALLGARQLSRPMRSLADSARQFGHGNLSARADESLPGEFGLLALELNRAIDAYRASEDAGRAQAAAEAASQAKSQFLAHMSHEIRTPMNAIVGMTDLALRTDLQPRQRDYLVRVRTAAGSLLGIINDILDFSKIEAGRLDLEETDFRVQDVLERVTSVIGVRANEKGLELLMSTSPEVPAVVRGDPLRLEQVLLNLGSNAVKFTEGGEIVVVTVKTVASDAPGTMLRFSVRDTGRGMTEAQVGALFQPFNQLDASTTRRHGGTGLGLAISRQLVHLMGGEIQVRSQPGKGSDFSFTAQFRAAAAPASTEPAPVQADVATLPAGFSVLVVDDSAAAREIFEDLVVELGGRPVCTGDAAGALAALETASFDVALLDWRLPDMDGFDLAARVVERLPACAVLLVTAYGNDDVQRRGRQEGLRGCLFKPVSRETLRRALAEVLAGPVSAAGTSPTGSPSPSASAAWAVLASPSAARAPAEAPPGLRGRRVLLVEDNEFNQIVAGDLLGDVAGMQVTIAGTGREALARLERDGFDVVLMDVQMPDMDGYAATRALRGNPRLASLPVIAMTAHALASDRERCLAAGMDDYLAKPFDPAELFAVLARWTHVSAAPAPRAPRPDGATGGIDLARGLRNCIGRIDLYRRIAERFAATRDRDPETLRAAVDAGDLDAVRFLAHTLISSAGTIGAARLSSLSRDLQAALADPVAIDRLPALLDDFGDEHARVMDDLSDYLADASDSPLVVH